MIQVKIESSCSCLPVILNVNSIITSLEHSEVKVAGGSVWHISNVSLQCLFAS